MKQKLAITVLVDNTTIDNQDPDFKESHPDGATEYSVINALRELNYQVSILGIDNTIDPLVKHLSEQPPNLVFNMTESFRSERKFDGNLAALIELMGIPFTGTGSAGLMLCRDKALCKNVLRAQEITVPRFFTVAPGDTIHLPKELWFPMVVKPLYEDGSDGISKGSLVKDMDELTERIHFIHHHFHEPAIIEEYIEGRELYVGMLGNARMQMLPIRELHFGTADVHDAPVLATYKVKWDTNYQKRWHINYGFSDLDEDIISRLREICCQVYRLLQIEDYGRIDIRLTDDNQIVILEANPNPAIGPTDDVAMAAQRAGIEFPGLIDKIVHLALKRHGKS